MTIGSEWATQFRKIGSFKVGGSTSPRIRGQKFPEKKYSRLAPGAKIPSSKTQLVPSGPKLKESWKVRGATPALCRKTSWGELEGSQNIGSVGSQNAMGSPKLVLKKTGTWFHEEGTRVMKKIIMSDRFGFVNKMLNQFVLPKNPHSPENGPSQKGNSSSNHWFSRGAVSFREGRWQTSRIINLVSNPKAEACDYMQWCLSCVLAGCWRGGGDGGKRVLRDFTLVVVTGMQAKEIWW